MKTYILFILLVFMFSFNMTAQKNKPASDKACCAEKGQLVSLEKYKGSVLVLYFFSDNVDNWNRPIAELNRLKEKYKDKKVHIGAITSKTTEEIDEYMKTMDFIMFDGSIDFAVVTDSDSAKKYKVKPPYVYVIAQNGTIYWKGKSLKNIGDKINEAMNSSANVQNKGTNVYNAKLTGEVSRFKNTTPKLNYDDSQGMDDPGVPEGTTFYKNDERERKTPATEAEEFDEDTQSQIPNQRIKEYKGTPGIKETKREFDERSIMSPDDD